MGDFNTFLNPSDKEGGAPVSNLYHQQFRNCINNCNLLEVPIVGDKFTWVKDNSEVKERLDWVFCNLTWDLTHPSFKAFHHLRYKSDHRIVVVSPEIEDRRQTKEQSFKYQAGWCLQEGFSDIVKSSWQNNSWSLGYRKFEETATKWNKEVIGSLPNKKENLFEDWKGLIRP